MHQTIADTYMANSGCIPIKTSPWANKIAATKSPINGKKILGRADFPDKIRILLHDYINNYWLWLWYKSINWFSIFLISKSLCKINIPKTNATRVFKLIIDLAYPGLSQCFNAINIHGSTIKNTIHNLKNMNNPSLAVGLFNLGFIVKI